MATSMVAVTVPALAVPLSVGRGPGAPIIRFVNQAITFFSARKRIFLSMKINFKFSQFILGTSLKSLYNFKTCKHMVCFLNFQI